MYEYHHLFPVNNIISRNLIIASKLSTETQMIKLNSSITLLVIYFDLIYEVNALKNLLRLEVSSYIRDCTLKSSLIL